MAWLKAHFSARSGVLGLCALLLPVLMLFVVCWSRGVYPFGDVSFLTEDLKYQYVDFFRWYRKVLTGELPLWYSSAPTLGNNTWGLWSYYLASPFAALVALWPKHAITDVVIVMTAAKLGLAGFTSWLWLHKRFTLSAPVELSLSLCYVWSSWTATQLRNPLWLDALVLLPLTLLAIWRCVRRGRWGFLVATLCTTIVTCWYMGWLTVVAVAPFATAEWAFAKSGERQTGPRTAALILGALCLTLVLCAWTFWPTLAAMAGMWSFARTCALLAFSAIVLGIGLALVSGRVGDRLVMVLLGIALALFVVGVLVISILALVRLGLPQVWTRITTKNWVFMAAPVVLVDSFFLGGWKTNVSPQLFAGALPLVGIGLAAVPHVLDKHQRKVALVLMLALLAGAVIRPLYIAWCGFRSPSGFYCRVGLFTAIGAVMVCALVLERARELRHIKLAAVGGIVVLWIAASYAIRLFVGANDFLPVSVGAGALLATGALIALAGASLPHNKDKTITQRDKYHRICARLLWLLPVVVAAEACYSASWLWQQLYGNYSQSAHTAWIVASNQSAEDLRALDPGWHRTARTDLRAPQASLNEELVQGESGISSYTSTSDPEAVRLVEALGYSRPQEMSAAYRAALPTSDALLGVRYVLSSLAQYGLHARGGIALSAGQTLYENSQALSLGYAASPEVCKAPISVTGATPFDTQNAFVSAIVGENTNLFEPLQAEVVREAPGERTWRVQVPAGVMPCAWVDPTDTGPLRIVASEITDGTHNQLYAAYEWDNVRFVHAVRPFAEVADKPRVFEITLQNLAAAQHTATQRLSSQETLRFAGWNKATSDSLISQLAPTQLTMKSWNDGHIVATIPQRSADQTGLLLTVPYDYGWTIKVDGQTLEARPAFEGALTYVELPQSATEHAATLEMQFRPPMLFEGIVVTAVSVLALGVRGYRRRSAEHKKACGASITPQAD